MQNLRTTLSLPVRNLLKIWKTSGLMSAQFDVIELLANEELYRFPLNTELEIYKLVDKCVRIFRPPDNPSRIVLKAPFNFHARIRAFDKTIQIIPTVLIENALKYAIPGSPIYVELSREDDWVILSVQNDSIGTQPLTENVFQRGYRASKDQDGSGNGLYLAQMVAQQHEAKLQLSSSMIRPNTMRCHFSIVFLEAK